MRVTVLGCSGSVGGPGAACSGYLFSVPGEQPVLMDCGPGVFGELMRVSDPDNIAVVLSHMHADHCLDLPAMMVWRRYAPPGPAPEKAPLYGPSGVAMRIGAASSEFPGEIDDISDTFDVHEWADGMEITLGGMNIHAIKLDHPPETYGLRVTGPEGHVIAFSGDTGPCDELIDLAADADLFLCEASWTHDPGNRPEHLHLSGIEAGEAAAKANAKALAITHVAPWCDASVIMAEARSTFSGPVELVRQGQIFHF
ncbi:beta-lactamase domain-containing protein [Gordonia polyisoprenivorans VH2]|uniref:Beta-lactamase domain-containing protein n=2 Tax=Gordonia polyisoprenivorans TaxID=84595 RepID=H6MW96_GORPV|nr:MULTISPECIES: cyclic nucleotide-degrading phosphodiesterase [Gordonia]AFA72910.1 beta-lactamase domain-containing protein [Gordonia polyisoprenivorans VH2]MBE7194459.1 MBL fold metallo-hydrolase [Gordonia polyisoprenivorans]NKY02514.1 MBL fold metallo-hydrolase [Gordonia polyisoprenivorans]OPX15939.1 MBL fold metallo-hydrolase [Gordonia sp. i37]OZC30054.1 MBL fold metallo-hydrolase [Gordonia polyisoprenivorans]